MFSAPVSLRPPVVATSRSDGGVSGGGSSVDTAALKALTTAPGSDAASTVDHILKKLNTLADAVKLKTKRMAVGAATVAPSMMSDSAADDALNGDDQHVQRLHASAVSSLRQDQILSPAARAASRARLEDLAAHDDRIAHASRALLTPGLVKFTPLPPLASSATAGSTTTENVLAGLQSFPGSRHALVSPPAAADGTDESASPMAHVDVCVPTSPMTTNAATDTQAARMAIGVPSEDEDEQDEEDRQPAAGGVCGTGEGSSGAPMQQVEDGGALHEPRALGVERSEAEGDDYVSFEVSRFRERVRGILGQGIAYTDIHRIFDATGDASEVTLPPPPTTMHVSWMQLLRRNSQVAEAAGMSSHSGSKGGTIGSGGAASPPASPLPLVDPSEKPPTNVLLPYWLRNRPDFRLVEEEQKSYGGARLQGKGLTGGAMVLVKRALESPGTMRGAKDIEILSMWLREQPQFSQLSALQLAVVARSLVAEHLDPSAKMSPTAESVYVVLSGYLHITRGSGGSAEIVGPGQSLGPRSWWSVLQAGVSSSGTGRLGRRISLVVAAAREEAKREATQMAAAPVPLPTRSQAPGGGMNARRSSISSVASFVPTPAPAMSGSAMGGGTQSHSVGPRRRDATGEVEAISSSNSSSNSSSAPQSDKELAAKEGIDTGDGTMMSLMRGFRGRRMSLFDASCIGRALSGQDVGFNSRLDTALSLVEATSPTTSSNRAEGLSQTAARAVRARMQGLGAADLDLLSKLTPDDVLDGVTLVRLGLGEYHDTLVRHRRMVNGEVAKYLHAQVRDFSNWGATRLTAVARAFESHTFKDQELVFQQDELADSLLLVQSGALKIFRRTNDVLLDTFPVGPHAWRRQKQLKQILLQVYQVGAGQWAGFEALAWDEVLSMLEHELRYLPRVQSESLAISRVGAPATNSVLGELDIADISNALMRSKKRRESEPRPASRTRRLLSRSHSRAGVEDDASSDDVDSLSMFSSEYEDVDDDASTLRAHSREGRVRSASAARAHADSFHSRGSARGHSLPPPAGVLSPRMSRARANSRGSARSSGAASTTLFQGRHMMRSVLFPSRVTAASLYVDKMLHGADDGMPGARGAARGAAAPLEPSPAVSSPARAPAGFSQHVISGARTPSSKLVRQAPGESCESPFAAAAGLNEDSDDGTAAAARNPESRQSRRPASRSTSWRGDVRGGDSPPTSHAASALHRPASRGSASVNWRHGAESEGAVDRQRPRPHSRTSFRLARTEGSGGVVADASAEWRLDDEEADSIHSSVLPTARSVLDVMLMREGPVMEPPRREVSAVACGECTVLFLRPEHFHLLHHKGLFVELQRRAQRAQQRIDDRQLLARRHGELHTKAAVKMLRNEAYGPRYTRSVEHGVVLVPETEAEPGRKPSTLGVLDLLASRDSSVLSPPPAASALPLPAATASAGRSNVSTTAARRSMHVSTPVSLLTSPGHDRGRTQGASSASMTLLQRHPHLSHVAGSATASPKSHVSSSQHTRTSSQLSRYGGDFSSDEDGASPRGSRRSTRSPKAGAARARTGSHAQLHARGVSKSTGVRLSQQQLGASASVPTLSGGIAQPSDRARIQGVASTTSLLPGVRMAPLPTAGLRHLRVPLPVYNTMTQQGSALLLNSGHDPKNPRLLRRLPIFSASTTALASTAGGGGGGGVAKLLGMPDVSRRRRSSVAEEATIERHDISSLTDRLSMLYSTADAADAAADAASTTVASDAGALGAPIVPLDASQSMETLGVSEKGTAPHQPASERRPLPSLVAAETVRGGHVSGAAAASAGDSVAARRRMKANLTYQSPLEKAHDDILAAWDARVAKTMEEIIRGTQGQDLDAPHGTLPSFWPDDAGLSRPAPSLATSDAAVTNLGPAGAVSEDASTGSRQRGRRSSLSLVQAVGSGSASPVRPHTGMVPSPSSMSLSRSPSPTSWRAANSGYLPANNATAAPARARMW